MIAQNELIDTRGLPLALGLIAGVRSATAPATLSAALAGGAVLTDDPLVALTIRLRPLLTAAALAEMGADKLPGMPDRTSPVALAGRVLLGAASGALAARAFGRPQLPAALLAGGAAAAATFASYHLRRLGSERIGLPGPAVGLIEDAALATAATALVRRLTPA
jgi:uncharacterized membrane protein